MNVQSDKAVRRRRRSPQRRVATVLEERQPKPFIFGWGAHLSRHEREAIKERIALVGGIVLGIAVVLLLAWGWYQDNIAKPAAIRAANNQPIASIGNYYVRMGSFKQLETYRENSINSQIQQIQGEISQLQSEPKSAANTVQISQLQTQLNSYQSQLGTLPSDTLSEVIDSETLLQRSATAGVPLTKKVENTAMEDAKKQAGGPIHLAQFIAQSGLSTSEFRDLTVAQYLAGKVQAKLAAKVSRYQTKVRASHILIASKNKALAVKLYHDVLKGANLAALARKYSQDPGSKVKGGDLGYFLRGTMVAPFDKAAFSMRVGQIRLVKSSYGWHIIKVTGRKTSRLTDTELSQAKQSAFQNWLVQQQNLVRVHRFLDPSQVPALAIPTPTSVLPSIAGQNPSGLPTGQNPSGLSTGQQPQPAPVQVRPQTTKKQAAHPSRATNQGKSKSTTKKP